MTPREGARALRRLAIATFVQMLPATLLSPAIRPLVALKFAGSEVVMQGFVTAGMLGAVLLVGLGARRLDDLAADRRWLAAWLFLDAVLLALLPGVASAPVFLGLRLLEGAVHVGAATWLLARASALGTVVGAGRAMGAAGGAVALAVGLGSGIGGALMRAFGPEAPFVIGAFLPVCVLLLVDEVTVPARATGSLPAARDLGGMGFPLAAAFLGRFTVGMLVVTFSLFAHTRHSLDDGAIGGLFMLLTLPFALGTYPAARLADRLGAEVVGAAGAAAFAVSLLVLGRVTATLLSIPMVTAGLGAALVYAAALRSSAEPAARLGRARVMGLVNVAGAAGMAIGPLAALGVGALATAAGLPRAESVFAAAALVLAAFVGAAGRSAVRRSGVPSRL